MVRSIRDNPAVSRLVERQMRNWELAMAQRPVTHDCGQQLHDFVALSQAAGTGGEVIAQLLAERLGWPLFDKQLLLAMAHDDELRARVFASVDERDMGWLEQIFRPLEDRAIVRSDYFHCLTQTVLYLVRHGNAVFLGRGADLILPKGVGLRVRLVAPLAERIARVSRQRQLSEQQALEELELAEQERASWLRHHFHDAADDPARFDLVLSCGTFSVHQVLDLIIEAMCKRRIAVPQGRLQATASESCQK